MEIILPREKFDQDGYLSVPNAITNPENLYCPPPVDNEGQRLTGIQKYFKDNKIEYTPVEGQVGGALARYNHPSYAPLHYVVRKLVQNILKIDLFPTYYYERFYYVGQELTRHRDRPSCEISVTLQMKNGDMVIYKGCEREHWREPLQSKYNRVGKFFNQVKKREDDTYHHQIFLHYINAQGPYVHFAYDQQ